ncbi:SpoIIE family protein phosphatase [Streptomyces sp. NPDC058691]|uniref:ATP-binding SpoIIE family protein phosphatase n=1 Tax=Streptomyces sp. NPDC058691 TaxID=3346601 RepID=UPI003646FB7B
MSAGPVAPATGSFEKALFDQARAGLEVYDADLRVLRANPASLRMRGMPARSVIGARLEELDAGIPLSPVVREALRTASALVERPVAAYPGGDPEHRHEYDVAGYHLQDGGGRTIGAACMFHDVTGQGRIRRGMNLLNVARARIGSTLDALRTAQELSDVSVPGFADAVAVDLLESVLSGHAPMGPIGPTLPMRRAGFKARGDHVGAYPMGAASYFAYPTPYTQALGDLQPRLVGALPEEGGWLVHDRARAEFIAQAGMRSLIVTPLTVHGLVLGLASFYRNGSRPDSFDEEDLSLATQLASCTALSLDNARRFTREHTIASALQRSLLPRTPPQVAAVEPAHCYLPGRYGAHWFDVLPLSSCRVGLVIGYVPGEDLYASVAMGRLRTAASTLAAMDLPPDELITHLDDVAQNMAREQQADPESLHLTRAPFTASCLYVTYDPITRQCSAATAGHDGPLLTTPEGAVSTLEVPRGAPLGRGAPHEMLTTELRNGSLLTLYSDSVANRYPAEAGERLSRLCDVVSDPATAPMEICDAVSYRLLRGTPQDGAALLVARLRGIDPDRIATWTFPAEAASVPEARGAARDRLAHWGLEEHVPVTDLVVSELATNVVRHAVGPIRLRLILDLNDLNLTVEVSDAADTAPHLRHARLQDENGRGLFIVASLTRHWGTRYEDDGKTIWAEQDLSAAA